jgi:hypothetical protein
MEGTLFVFCLTWIVNGKNYGILVPYVKACNYFTDEQNNTKVLLIEYLTTSMKLDILGSIQV